MWELILPLISFLVGIVAAMAGIGGGVFIVPMLILLYGLEPACASGTSIAMIVFTSLSSTLRYSRQKRIDYLLGLALAATTVPGAFLGAYATSIINRQILGLIFAFFLIFIAIRMLIGKGRKENDEKMKIRVKNGKIRKLVDSYGKVFTYSVNFWLTPVLGLVAGFFSGLLGIGGGAVLVPAMNLAIGVPIHITVATSMFIMIFTSISGALTHFWLQHIRFDYAAMLILGIIFGAQIGAHYAAKVSAKNLRRVFGVVLFIASIRMILKFTYLMP